MATTATPLPSATASEVTLVLSGTGTGAAETIFTPPTGKRWRLIGWQLTAGSAAIVNIFFREAGTIIRIGACANAGVAPFNQTIWSTPDGHRPHESAASAVLQIDYTAGEELGGQVFLQVF